MGAVYVCMYHKLCMDVCKVVVCIFLVACSASHHWYPCFFLPPQQGIHGDWGSPGEFYMYAQPKGVLVFWITVAAVGCCPRRYTT